MLEGRTHFLDLHGQHGARLSRQQSIHDPRDGRILVNIISPLLFFGPQEHFSKLIELSTDCIVKQIDWERFLAETVDEWRSHTLFVRIEYPQFPVQTYAHSIGNSGVERQRRVPWYAVSEQREIGVWKPIVGSKDKLCFNCC